jgi:CHRD domain-containing protein
MGKLAVRGLVLTVVIALLGVGSYAIAGGGTKNFRGIPLNGYEENPDISTVATGSFEARLSNDGTSIHYKLTYSGLEGDVLQSHVHFGKPAVNGGISFFLCANGNTPAPAPPNTPACPGPHSGTVEDDIVAADVIGPTGQGIEVGNLAEILDAMRAGHAYANVHSTKWPGGEIRAQLSDHGNSGRGPGGDDD